MSWPEAADYDLVVQNPSLSFIDSELAGGHAQQNLMGFPKSFSGNFAIVYVIETWLSVKAVKCFIKEHSEQYRRYEAISECLARLQSPYFVEFEYILNGIKLKGGQYPVLKMDWVSGDLLYSYIEKNIADSAKLMFLAERWREMAVSLHRSGIAHGDLQHGNVIIHNEQIKLIDYDGMYVHALANLKATESGVRHFQHPSRSDQFGPYLDNFSHWIIYTTLVALSLDPSLWSKFNNDEPEFLLFKRSDFDAPHSSALLTCLRSHAEERLQKYAQFIEQLLRYELEHIPPLEPELPLSSKTVLWWAQNLPPKMTDWWLSAGPPTQPRPLSSKACATTSAMANGGNQGNNPATPSAGTSGATSSASVSGARASQASGKLPIQSTGQLPDWIVISNSGSGSTSAVTGVPGPGNSQAKGSVTNLASLQPTVTNQNPSAAAAKLISHYLNLASDPYLYVQSPAKLLMLTLSSFGAYACYFFLLIWLDLRARTHLNKLFSDPLDFVDFALLVKPLSQIRNEALYRRCSVDFNPAAVAAGLALYSLLILNLLWRCFVPCSDHIAKLQDFIFMDSLYIALALCLIPVQLVMNELSGLNKQELKERSLAFNTYDAVWPAWGLILVFAFMTQNH